MKRLFFLLLLALLLATSTASARLNVSVTQNPAIYQILDTLTAFGLIDDYIIGQRPYSLSEVIRLINEAQKNLPRIRQASFEPRAIILIDQLKGFLDEEGEEKKDAFLVTPLKQFSLQQLYLSSPYRAVPVNNGSGFIDAIINPFVSYRGGRPYQDGENFVYESEHEIHFAPYFDLSGQPQFFFEHPNNGNPDVMQWNYDHLYLRSEFSNVGIQVGRDQLVWGPDPEGGSIFSTNARGLDMIKISNVSPFRLPWIFKYFGKMDASFFFGVLGKDQPFPYPYLTGFKLSFLPHKNFEWAFTTAEMSGGFGSPRASLGSRVVDTFLGFIPNIFGGDNPLDNTASNRIGSFEFMWRIPQWRGLQFYYEFTLDDLSIEQYKFVHESVNRVGLHMPRLSNDGRNGLRLEYQHSGFLPYRHGQFISGWTNHQRLMGDELGPDGQSVYATYSFKPTIYWQNSFQFAWETRDSDVYLIPNIGGARRIIDNLSEDRYRLTSANNLKMNQNLHITLNLGYERVQSFNFVPGNDRNNFLTDIKLTWYPEFGS